jgi:hypothetical protein
MSQEELMRRELEFYQRNGVNQATEEAFERTRRKFKNAFRELARGPDSTTVHTESGPRIIPK